jgi:hypothetical protein
MNSYTNRFMHAEYLDGLQIFTQQSFPTLRTQILYVLFHQLQANIARILRAKQKQMQAELIIPISCSIKINQS